MRTSTRKLALALVAAVALAAATLQGLRTRRDLAIRWRDRHAAILGDRLENPGGRAFDPAFRKALDHHAALVSKWDDVARHPWKLTWPDPPEPR